MDINKIKALASKAGLTKEKFTDGVINAVRGSIETLRKETGQKKVAFMVRPVAPDLGFLTCTPMYYKQGPNQTYEKVTILDIPFESVFIPPTIMQNNILKMTIKAATGKSLDESLGFIREHASEKLLKESSYLIITTDQDNNVILGFFKLENGKQLSRTSIEKFSSDVFDQFETIQGL
jgi:hypothetical protein